MTSEDLPGFDPALDLVLVRELAAPRAVIWECWTKAEHLMHWFVPRPHRVTACRLDVRVGGACDTTFDVDGTVMEIAASIWRSSRKSGWSLPTPIPRGGSRRQSRS